MYLRYSLWVDYCKRRIKLFKCNRNNRRLIMKQYIDKSALVAEIERKRNQEVQWMDRQGYSLRDGYADILSFLNSLEVKELDTWHLQEKEDIYDAVKDWSIHIFSCIMKDGTIQTFTGCRDEDCEGHINVHIDGVNYYYDNVNDIVKWTELKM